MVSDVGMAFATVAPVGTKERLFVRLTCRGCPAGTVITTGDHTGTVRVPNSIVGGTATFNAGFRAAQVAVEPVTAVPQP
jgi:hypothetical protein